MSKIFVMHFEDGFDITTDLRRIKWVVEQSSDVEIRTREDAWQAYLHACLHHAKKKLSRQPFVAVSLPKFEDVLKAPFYERIVPARTTRFFALVAENYHASISTKVMDVINFLDMFEYPLVKECYTYDEALGAVNLLLVTPVMAMGAYLKGDIPFIDELDESVSVFPYKSWLKQNCELPPEKLFTPAHCVASQDEKDFTVPLELVEPAAP